MPPVKRDGRDVRTVIRLIGLMEMILDCCRVDGAGAAGFPLSRE